MKTLRAVLVLFSVSSSFAFAQTMPEGMGAYQLVLLKSGPNIATAATPEGRTLVKAHVDHLYKLGNEGTVATAGPFIGGGDIQGILLVAASTPEKALEIEGDDPGVKAGLFVMEALPLMSAKTNFGKWAEFGKFERVYFGFLNRGANSTQDAKSAQSLQEQHLAYMTEKHVEGKLPAAGPFMKNGERRGIVVYRTSTFEEAKQLAEGDPMVKAGRLSVELYTWQVPIGSISVSNGAASSGAGAGH